MSIRQGNNIIAGARKKNCVLFEPQWFDYTISDINWVRADNFAWHDGYIYSAAYEHLRNDIHGSIPPEERSETIGGTTIYYKLSPDGHKIVGTSEESNVQAIYESTGVSWYYVLDEGNHRFKLPRTKFAFTGFRDSVGKYVAPGLPQHNHLLGVSYDNNGNWASSETSQLNSVIGYKTGVSTAAKQGPKGANRDYGVSGTFGDRGISEYLNKSVIGNASDSIYGASSTVQSPATQMYLYFYIGEFTQSALENLANINIGVLAEITSYIENLNAHRVINFQAPTAENNYTWYRKYADGWVEQGCLACYLPAQSANTQAATTCSLPITMADSAYHVDCIRYTDGGDSYELTQIKVTRNTNSCLVYYFSTVATSNQSQCAIRVEGMAAS